MEKVGGVGMLEWCHKKKDWKGYGVVSMVYKVKVEGIKSKRRRIGMDVATSEERVALLFFEA